MKMKSARAFYFALCPFAVAAFTGYMLALMQGNKPLVLAGVCSTIQGKIIKTNYMIFSIFLLDFQNMQEKNYVSRDVTIGEKDSFLSKLIFL